MATKTLEQEIEDLKEELAERDETISELKSEIREQENQIKSLEEQIDDLEIEVDDFENNRKENTVVLNLDTFYWGLQNGNLAVQQAVESFVSDLKRRF